MDHLLLHRDVAYSLWEDEFNMFRIHRVMIGSIANLLIHWRNLFRKYRLNVWNLVPGCLMWIVWREQNCCSFEDTISSLDQLKSLLQHVKLPIVPKA